MVEARPAERPTTLGALKASGWTSRTVKDEVRDNLIEALREGRELFPGVIGYERTVVPQVVNALLSRHDLILLGLRGQAKTRLARGIVRFLDEWSPIVAGSPLNEDPFRPLTDATRARLDREGDDLAVEWVHRDRRFQEKLATPDVAMSDLIGDIDPIKAASEGRSFMDPEVIQYGLIPRTNRGLFVVNELPDLPTRIQVGLFNLLEEKDVQIRGFPIRLPLDLLLVFTANPEDYTNRGNIVTPLRDRIRSQIHTHYPHRLEDGMRITVQESWVERDGVTVHVPEWLREAVEETAIQARASSFVDQSSGVSARVTVALLENVVSNAERRGLRSGETEVCARPVDLHAALPGLAGKIELVFEGEQEGPLNVCRHLIGQGLKAVLERRLPDPYAGGEGDDSPYSEVLAHFQKGATVTVSEDAGDVESLAALSAVPGLRELAEQSFGAERPAERVASMEAVLEGLTRASLLTRRADSGGAEYRDSLGEMAENLED